MVPFAPGGATDVAGRLWAERIKPLIGTVIVENRASGGGTPGAAEVARAPADGYTFLLGNTSTQVLVPAIMPRPPYDPPSMTSVKSLRVEGGGRLPPPLTARFCGCGGWI